MLALTPSVVFTKNVAKCMASYGYYVTRRVAKYFDADGDQSSFAMWSDLLVELRHAVLRDLQSSPKRVMDFLISITEFLTPDTVDRYRQLTYHLFREDSLHAVWPHARGNDTAIYAAAIYFLLAGPTLRTDFVLANATASMLGKPFIFGADQETWNHEFTTALFGPTWNALYMQNGMTEKEIIEAISQRPPITVLTPPSLPEVDMPTNCGGHHG